MKRESRRKPGRPPNTKPSEPQPIGTFTPEQIEKFWARVNKNGAIPIRHPELGQCWHWLGGTNGRGYGQVRINYRQVSPHQVAWELKHGAVPTGFRIKHQCENRDCCNPDHLFLGTADNTNTGERKPYSTGTTRHHITNAEVKAVRAKATSGISLVELAREYEVSPNTIANIIKGRTRNRQK